MKNIDVIKTKNLHSLNGVYLKNYNTIIAVNRGDVVYVNNNRYSKTTTTIQKLVCKVCEDLKISIRTTGNIEEVM